MRIAGINWLAVLIAAIAIYAVGYGIFVMLLDPQYLLAVSGHTQEQMDAVGTSRMAYGPLMPLATAIGMAVLFKWGNVAGLMNGVKWGALIACFSAVPAVWYYWVYGVGDCTEQLIDSAHLLIGHSVAGAILASWK